MTAADWLMSPEVEAWIARIKKEEALTADQQYVLDLLKRASNTIGNVTSWIPDETPLGRHQRHQLGAIRSEMLSAVDRFVELMQSDDTDEEQD